MCQAATVNPPVYTLAHYFCILVNVTIQKLVCQSCKPPLSLSKTSCCTLLTDNYTHMYLPSRSEKKLVSKEGAVIELYITAIKLEVPKGAFEGDTVVQLATLDKDRVPKIPTDFGEVVLSDIIKVGPDDASFKVPAILSIPHSISEVPKHSSICINHFDSDARKWVRLPCSSGKYMFKSCTFRRMLCM